MSNARMKDSMPTTAKDKKAVAKPRRLAKMPASSELKIAPTLKAACRQPKAKLKQPVFSETSFAISTISMSQSPAHTPSSVSQGNNDSHGEPPAWTYQTSVAAVRRARMVTVKQAVTTKGLRPKSARRPATTEASSIPTCAITCAALVKLIAWPGSKREASCTSNCSCAMLEKLNRKQRASTMKNFRVHSPERPWLVTSDSSDSASTPSARNSTLRTMGKATIVRTQAAMGTALHQGLSTSFPPEESLTLARRHMAPELRTVPKCRPTLFRATCRVKFSAPKVRELRAKGTNVMEMAVGTCRAISNQKNCGTKTPIAALSKAQALPKATSRRLPWQASTRQPRQGCKIATTTCCTAFSAPSSPGL
mmetsp:Transcript_57860/g.137788  ORF Transcript_57860/g.137788 Transcript_57860/m.137788 type:complete len:365 (+) Transcript_57860:445-1539(+)